MATKHRVRLDVIFKTALSISLIISGICLMVGCISIYYSGADQPYTREIVAQTFKTIEIPIFVSLALIAITFIGAVTNPDKEKRTFSKLSHTKILKRLAEKRDISNNAELADKVLKERHIRKKHTVIWAVINSLSAGCFLFYALDFSNFDRSDINGSMISAMLVLLPCLSVSFAVSLLFFILNQKSMQREIELLKTAPLKSDSEDNEDLSIHLKKEKKLRIIKLVLLAFFLGLAILGFVLGGTADVLTKAVNICTECIGLG